MSGIPDFTTVVAVDREHLAEFEITWQTWREFKPEIIANPLLVMVDSPCCFPRLGHRNINVIPWNWRPDLPQRERMLTALVRAADYIETPYYLKLDTDCLATSAGPWIDESWFEFNPAFVASPWSYSKPSDAIQRLDDWGDTVEGIREFPRLNILFDPASRLVKHRRMISWAMFGNTAWTRRMSALAPDRLPVPSQDTFLGYCAARRGDYYVTARMSHRGWAHVGGGLSKLRRVASEVLSAAGVTS